MTEQRLISACRNLEVESVYANDKDEAQSHTTEIEIDNLIDAWHASGSTKSLYEFLGWTREEYWAWVRNPNCVPKRGASNG